MFVDAVPFVYGKCVFDILTFYFKDGEIDLETNTDGAVRLYKRVHKQVNIVNKNEFLKKITNKNVKKF